MGRASSQQIFVTLDGLGKAIAIPDPVVNDKYEMHKAQRDLTISQVVAVVKGTTPSVTIKLTHAADTSGAGTEILNTPIAITNTTTGQSLTTFNDNTIPQGNWIMLELTAVSGVVNRMTVEIFYSFD